MDISRPPRKKPARDQIEQPASAASRDEAGQTRPARLVVASHLPPGSRVYITVTAKTTGDLAASGQPLRPSAPHQFVERKEKKIRQMLQPRRWSGAIAKAGLTCAVWLRRFKEKFALLPENNLFALSLLFYAVTRLAGLLRFPANITPQGASSQVLAVSLVTNRLHDVMGHFLPSYLFYGESNWQGLTVYLQAVGFVLFGQSPWMARALPALLTVLLAYELGHLLRDGFEAPYWWSAPLLLAAIPAWFSLSRSALAPPLGATLFTAAAARYLQYRQGHAPSLYRAVVLLVLTAWTFPTGLILSLLTGLVLLIADFRYHKTHYPLTAKALGMAALLAAPALRTIWNPPVVNLKSLVLGHTLFLEPVPTMEKFRWMLANLAQLLDLAYWFSASWPGALASAPAAGYELLHWAFILLALAGIWQCLRRRRNPAASLLALMVLLAVISTIASRSVFPDGLILIAPLALLSGLGFSALLGHLEKIPALTPSKLRYSLFLVWGIAGLLILNNTLRRDSAWSASPDGTSIPVQRVFELARDYAIRHPDQQVYLSIGIDEQLDLLRRFYTPAYNNIGVSSLQFYTENQSSNLENAVFMITPQEYRGAVANPIFDKIDILEIIQAPDGQPAIYLVKLAYPPHIPE